jgi:hypothetical protein
MKHRQNLRRTAGYADVRIIVVTRRWVVPSGPDCAGCNEDCQGGRRRIQSSVTAPTEGWPMAEHRQCGVQAMGEGLTQVIRIRFRVQITTARDERVT